MSSDILFISRCQIQMDCTTLPFLKLVTVNRCSVYSYVTFFQTEIEVQPTKLQKWLWKTAHTDKTRRLKDRLTDSFPFITSRPAWCERLDRNHGVVTQPTAVYALQWQMNYEIWQLTCISTDAHKSQHAGTAQVKQLCSVKHRTRWSKIGFIAVIRA